MSIVAIQPSAGGVFKYNGYNGLYGDNNDTADSGFNCIQIGIGAVANGTSYASVAIGINAKAPRASVAIGNNANGGGLGIQGVAIGYYSTFGASFYSVAVGARAQATGSGAIAIGGYGNYGYGTRALNSNSIAIGFGAYARHNQAVAIGRGVESPAANSVTLGVSNTEDFTLDTWVPVASAATPSTHVLPILINGTRYNILMTT